MKESIKQKILFYLTEKRDWCYGGVIEDYIRQTDGHKASNASRRCRELEDEGKIERRIVKKDSLNVVQYRIKQAVPEWFINPKVPQQPVMQKLF
jgi:predicted transcriptional regulator